MTLSIINVIIKIKFTNVLSFFSSAWSYYGPPSYGPQPYTRIIYRHHVPFHPQMAYMSPVPAPVPFAPTIPFAPPAAPVQYVGARHVAPYYASPSLAHPMSAPFVPAASHQQSYYSRPHMMPAPTSPRYPFKTMAINPFGAYSQPAPKESIFTKIKPYIFGGTGPRSHPHHPHYPNLFPPHQFTPNRPYLNRPAVHHGYPVFSAHHGGMHHPQKSCSCSLHVGQLTVYKHTDLRSSYSCHDIKDCNNFCTNLVSELIELVQYLDRSLISS